jgi:cell division septal protein FtsQ
MKKLYRIVLLILVLIFLSTYSPNKFDLILEKNNTFLKIQKIKIVNNFLIKSSEIKEKLSKIYNRNIFSIKKKDIEEPLKEINFLEKVEVKKKYPNTIVVKIFETKPVAILYKNKAKYLLDSSSNLIFFENNMNFNQLPSVFGIGAENYFVYFFNQLENNNFPINNIKKFYFFQIGRWDLQLANDKMIKLPHDNIEDAIKKSIELLNRKDFQNYNIIDLRVDGKIIVE